MAARKSAQRLFLIRNAPLNRRAHDLPVPAHLLQQGPTRTLRGMHFPRNHEFMDAKTFFLRHGNKVCNGIKIYQCLSPSANRRYTERIIYFIDLPAFFHDILRGLVVQFHDHHRRLAPVLT